MKVTLNLTYTADADRAGETAADEHAALDAIENAANEFVAAIRRNAEAQGLTVTVTRS